MENQSYGELKLLTPAEEAMEARNAAICEDYKQMKEKARPWRIFASLARKYSMTPTNIYYVVSGAGLYKSRS